MSIPFFRSLRARVAGIVFVSTSLTLAAVGFALITGYQSSNIDRIDKSIHSRVKRVQDSINSYEQALTKRAEHLKDEEGRNAENGEGAPVLNLASAATEADPNAVDPTGILVVIDGKLAYARGKLPPEVSSAPAGKIRTVNTENSGQWRLLATDVDGERIVTGTSLEPTRARVRDLTERGLIVGLIGLVLAAFVAWLTATLATGSLRRLRKSADRVSGTDDLDLRVPEPPTPIEVASLAQGINNMLERLEDSYDETAQARDSARRFAAEAGHEMRTPLTALGTNIDLLALPGALEKPESADLITHIREEHVRLVRLLNSLQALARGEAAADLPREKIDLADIAGAAVMAVGSGNRTFDLSVDAPEDGVPYTGQPEGLRRMCENLLENAVRHGKPNGKAVMSVTPDPSGTGVTLACDDDGPGIPADEREIVKGRFERGSAATGNGSGLGLALVEQQAILHGGHIIITDSALGGARVEAHLT